jgi:hypothetical protein
LLFFVLFYVYPLKFVFTAMFDSSVISASEARALFMIWSLGYAAVFSVFTLLYLHAWRIRAPLALTALETMRTQVSLSDNLAMVIVALLSAASARLVADRFLGIAGYIYIVVPFYFWIVHSITGRRERRLHSQHSVS